MIDDEKPEDGEEADDHEAGEQNDGLDSGDAVGGHPEEQEEKGIGLTEEFARLEQEIKREVGETPDADAEAEAEPDAQSDEAESGESVAPVPSGDTEVWSAGEGESGDDAGPEAGEHATPELPAEETDDEEPVSEEQPIAEEGTAIEHTVVRHRPPPIPIAASAYDDPDEDPEVTRPGLWWRFLTASVVIVVAVATATAVSSLVFLTNVAGKLQPIPGLQDKLDDLPPGDPQTILIVGSDKRADTPGDPGRSDTTMLLRVDPDKGVLSLFSLPRDLKVDIAGANYGEDKLNAAYSYGGIKKTLQTVKDLTGLEINHVVNVDFTGFAKAVDAIGCVYVDVDRHYFNDNSTAISSLDTFAEINVNAGYQRLCGQNALDYVRYRHTDTDIVRAARQQDFLRNARAQVPVSEVLPILGGDKGSKLLDIFTKYTSSDINSAAQLIGTLQAFIDVRDVPINQISFEGTLGASYVTATPEQISTAVDEFLNGKDEPGPTADESTGNDGSGGGDGSSDKSKDKSKQDSASDGANVISTSDVIDSESGINKFEAFGRTSSRRLKFPVYIPTKVVPGSAYSEDSRQYDIKDEDDKKQPAYKLVIEYAADSGTQYYGVQGTTWSEPPILEHPSETITSDGRDYDIYYDGDRIRMVAWHDDEDNAYWVSNTLVQTLDNADMIAIAESMEEAHG